MGLLLNMVDADLKVPLGVEVGARHHAHKHVGPRGGHVIHHGRVEQQVLARQQEVDNVVLGGADSHAAAFAQVA